MSHFLGRGVVEEHCAAASKRRAVVEQQGGAAGQAGDQPVPHHPAAGREVEQPIAGTHVAVQLVLLEMLEQHPAVAMDNAFRHAGRATREHDVERVSEADAFENWLFFRVDRGNVIPDHGMGDVAHIGGGIKIGHQPQL